MYDIGTYIQFLQIVICHLKDFSLTAVSLKGSSGVKKKGNHTITIAGPGQPWTPIFGNGGRPARRGFSRGRAAGRLAEVVSNILALAGGSRRQCKKKSLRASRRWYTIVGTSLQVSRYWYLIVGISLSVSPYRGLIIGLSLSASRYRHLVIAIDTYRYLSYQRCS